MEIDAKLDLARRYLQGHELTNTVTFRRLTLDHFTAEELRKIVEIAMNQYKREVQFYKNSVDTFQTINESLLTRLKEAP